MKVSKIRYQYHFLKTYASEGDTEAANMAPAVAVQQIVAVDVLQVHLDGVAGDYTKKDG